ncbi:MAG TPA: radical SAM family heme chaperone HemW [Verrucomicrobiae bacterium]|jgi:oxygen-independent coproporphyrinogen-3 oxidase|nr:radical SAM family heme chaperone HemW [Verrucomicrobiae bacterium]
MPNLNAPRIASLYVHVPFCAQKCVYCAFYSEASSGELINRYVAALIREMEIVADDLKPRTIFFGGGTPSLLNLRQWEQILRAMEKLNLLGAEEFTVECNPATVSADKAKLFRDFGINRISMGVQSLDEKLLDRLGRIHSREMVFKSFDILRQAGFENVNLDLMFAIPGQTMEIWRATLNEAMAMQSEHLSSYEVIYEDDTLLFQQLQAGEFSVDENLACEMYEELISSATRGGFQQYEIANFAKQSKVQSPKPKAGAPTTLDIPVFACKHNVNYWRGGSFYGLGPSATGYIRGGRTKNWSNTQLYCDQLEKGKRAIESSEELSPLRRAGEIAAFGLRMNAGWPFEQFQRATDFDLRNEWKTEMEQLTGRGWATHDDEKFQLSAQGLRFADSAAELFLR